MTGKRSGLRRSILIGMFKLDYLLVSEIKNESDAKVRNKWNFAYWYFRDSETTFLRHVVISIHDDRILDCR